MREKRRKIKEWDLEGGREYECGKEGKAGMGKKEGQKEKNEVRGREER